MLETRGGLTVNGGTLSNLGSGGSSAYVPYSNTTWTFGGTAASTVSANINLNYAGVTLAVGSTGTGTDTTVTGAISGANGFVKTGSGTLTLTGLNTYSGGTTVSDGTVTLTGAGQLLMKIANGSVSNAITVASGATLNLDGALALDLTGLTDGAGTWTLITGSGTKNYNASTFVVKTSTGTLFTKAGTVWTNGAWNFDQATGLLTAVPEPSTYGLLAAGALAGASLVRRRRRK